MISYINGTKTYRFSLTDPLLCAGLSARAYNTLVEANIQTIQDLLRCDRKQLENIRGMGRKSVEEVLDFLHHLWTYPDRQKVYPLPPEHISLLGSDAFYSWSEQIPEDLMDRPLSVLPLSVRAYNCLRRSGYNTLGALSELSYKDILKIRSLGKRTADEILDAMNHYIQTHSCLPVSRIDRSTPASQACYTFFHGVFRSSLICDLSLYREILDEFESAYDNARPVDYASLYRNELLRQAAAAAISEILDQYPFGLEREQLSQLVPETFKLPDETLEIILGEMEEKDSIRINGKIYLCRMSIAELVDKIPDDRLKGILLQRLSGLPLREISGQYHLSQERVRQIISEGITKCATKVEEDKYLPIFKQYRFTKEEFMLAFCEPVETYHYLTIKAGNTARIPISQYVEDSSFPVEIRQGICRLLHRDSVSINGEYIERNQTSLTRLIMLTYFPKDDVSFDTLFSKYNELLRTLGLEKDPKLFVHERSYINHLRAMDFLLWKPGCTCRYYDLEARDYDELLDTLGLEHYHNAEYSTRKFFRSEPDLMRKYDVRDEYELHNLLRKVCTKRQMKGIQFLRMPFISFGVSDRSRQVYEVLLAHSPISQRSFLEQYDAIYGLDPKTNPQQYLAPFAKYCREGIYDVRSTQVQTEQEGAVTPSLRQDIPLSRSGC